MSRWVCLKCGEGKLAPERMRKLDSRRWCLTCSASSPTLVERVQPAKERAKAKKVEARAVRTSKRKEVASGRVAAARAERERLANTTEREYLKGRAWLVAWLPRILALKAWQERRWAPSWPPKVTIRQGRKRSWSSGHAWTSSQRCVVTTGQSAADDLATLVHEIAHLVAPVSEHHGAVFCGILSEAWSELLGREVTPMGEGTYSNGIARKMHHEWGIEYLNKFFVERHAPATIEEAHARHLENGGTEAEWQDGWSRGVVAPRTA